MALVALLRRSSKHGLKEQDALTVIRRNVNSLTFSNLLLFAYHTFYSRCKISCMHTDFGIFTWSFHFSQKSLFFTHPNVLAVLDLK